MRFVWERLAMANPVAGTWLMPHPRPKRKNTGDPVALEKHLNNRLLKL